MAKTKSKVKFDFKDFLLKKGEYLAMGIAGFFLFLLLVWGVTKWGSAKDPVAINKELTSKASSVQSQIAGDQVSDADKAEAELPAWVQGKIKFNFVPAEDFKLTNPQFDPTAKPDTKKENPHVLQMGTYQVDLIRGSMKGFDIVPGTDGEQMIAVIYGKKTESQDQEKLRALAIKLKKGKKGKKGQPKAPPGNVQRPPGLPGPGGPGGPPGGGGLGGGGLGGGGLGGDNPYGGPGGFQFGAQRVEKAIEYVPVAQLDAAIAKQKVPAMTVIPVRMVTVHAEIPMKKQIEEIKRALRFKSTQEAAQWGPVYDGFRVKRRVTSFQNGEEIVIQDWSDYDFEEAYRERIHALRGADHLEEGFYGYFFRYEMNLALPLPELVTETGATYPNIRLKNTLETIKKLEEATKGKEDPSEIFKRVNKKGSRDELYQPQGGNDTGANSFGGAGLPEYGQLSTMSQPPGKGAKGGAAGNMFNPLDPGSNPNQGAPVEIDHLLLRFVDPAVEPGLTYQYQIQLVMKNPNFGRKSEVSKPADAEKELLLSPWVQTDAIPVPAETFLFATDWDAYTRKIREEYDREPQLKSRLEAKEHQAVVETLSWMEQVRTGDGGKREPVGAWVVADYAVGRGEFIGRKQYVKLPLWSSENMSYVLRELPDKIVTRTGTKETSQPKGWLMDFTNNKSILVDFEGGKTRTRVGTKEVNDEIATEMLVLRGDGKLVIKRSADAQADSDRKEIVGKWENWLKEVVGRKDGGVDDGSGFAPRPPGPGNP